MARLWTQGAYLPALQEGRCYALGPGEKPLAQAERSLLHIVTWRAQSLVTREDYVGHHLVLGSDPTRADVLLEDSQVASEHALVEHDGERVWVHALEGAPAVRINGVPKKRARVHPGDDVALGNTVVHLRVLSPAVAKRWQQTIAYDDAALPPRADAGPSDAPASADSSAPPGAELPMGPDWVLPHLPEATRRALLGPLPPAAKAALRTGEPEPETRFGVAVLEVGRDLEAFRLVRRRWRMPRPKPLVGRYDTPITLPSPLRLHLVRADAALVHVQAGLPWVLARGGVVDDEQGGVRKNWAHRGRLGVRIRMQPGDILRVRIGARTWVTSLVPRRCKKLPTRAQPVPLDLPTKGQTPPSAFVWRPWAAGAWVALCTVLATVFALPYGGHAAKTRRDSLRPPGRLAEVVLDAHMAAEPGFAAAMAEASAPAARLKSLSEAPMGSDIPGGSSGYRLFGMVLPEPVVDPTSAPGAPLAPPERAWLRGSLHLWRPVLEHWVGGPPWLLDCDAQDVHVADTRLTPERLAAWLVAHPEPFVECWAKSRPKAQKVRLAASLRLASDGRVRAVRPTSSANNAGPGSAWEQCLQAKRSAWHAPHFVGQDVAAEVTVTLWPWPS